METEEFELFTKNDIQQFISGHAKLEEEERLFITRCQQAIEKRTRTEVNGTKKLLSGITPEKIDFKIVDHSDYLKIMGDLVCVKNCEGESVTIVGEVEILFFDEQRVNLKRSFKSINRFARETMSYFNVRGHKSPFSNDAFSLKGKVALIDRFYIFPEFRGSGHGSLFIKQVINYLKNEQLCDFIVLKPYSLFESSDNKIKEKVAFGQELYELIASLVLFYEKYGFKTQSSDRYFYQCLQTEK